MFKDITSSKRIEIKPGAAGVVISEDNHDFTNTQGGVMGIRKSLGRKGLLLGANLVPAGYTGPLELQIFNGGANTVEIMAGERVGNLLVINNQPVDKYVLVIADVDDMYENAKVIEKVLEPLTTGKINEVVLQWGSGNWETEYTITRIDSGYGYRGVGVKSGTIEKCKFTALSAVIQTILNDIGIAIEEQKTNEK